MASSSGHRDRSRSRGSQGASNRQDEGHHECPYVSQRVTSAAQDAEATASHERMLRCADSLLACCGYGPVVGPLRKVSATNEILPHLIRVLSLSPADVELFLARAARPSAASASAAGLAAEPIVADVRANAPAASDGAGPSAPRTQQEHDPVPVWFARAVHDATYAMNAGAEGGHGAFHPQGPRAHSSDELVQILEDETDEE